MESDERPLAVCYWSLAAFTFCGVFYLGICPELDPGNLLGDVFYISSRRKNC